VHLLYNVQPGDPITFFGVAILFVSVAFLAYYMSALRATKVDPTIALRDS
jgi:ABC-type antimicrobial peptide transport system permease subunit